MTGPPLDPVPVADSVSEPLDEPADDAPVEDEPWPAARGPHLPDFLRLLPGPAWVFILLALGRLAWGLREDGFSSGIDPWRIGQVVLFEMPSVVSILLPAALLARHRDAPSRLRAILAGAVLLAMVEGLRVLGSPLEPFFESLTPGDATVTFLVPSALAYQVTINMLNAAAVAAMGVGLVRARRFEDRVSSWPVAAALAALVVVIAVTGIGSVSRLPAEQLPMTATVVAYVLSTVLLNVLSATAFGYLTATATAGARAGEDPGLAWSFAAIGSWLVIGSLAALGVGGLVESTPDTAWLVNDVVVFIESVFSVGFVALLFGFVFGLPALDAFGEPDEEDSFADDDGDGGAIDLAEPSEP